MSVRIETSKFSLSCTVTPGLQIMPPNKIHFDYFHTRYDVIIANNAEEKVRNKTNSLPPVSLSNFIPGSIAFC